MSHNARAPPAKENVLSLANIPQLAANLGVLIPPHGAEASSPGNIKGQSSMAFRLDIAREASRLSYSERSGALDVDKGGLVFSREIKNVRTPVHSVGLVQRDFSCSVKSKRKLLERELL